MSDISMDDRFKRKCPKCGEWKLRYLPIVRRRAGEKCGYSEEAKIG
jgi:uncharacterized protein (DUF983 family)